MKAFFFDIFGTLVDWRSSIISGLKNLDIFNNRLSELELFVINWRKEYQPILNKVNDNSIGWKILDELHEVTLETVLNRMNFSNVTNEEKKYLILLWHKLNPWSDSCKAIKQLNEKYITASLSNGNITLQKNLFKYANLNFDFIFSAEHFKKYKPNKIVYRGAVEMLNLKIDQCVLVASHKNDLHAAANFGMKTIYINRAQEYGSFKNEFKEKTFKADLEISSLNNILNDIKKLKN
ncbi:MAG: haloacid dehalogenase type II [Pelagibacterales bacterium]|nr:haloacid dehalogenase type II [Pelagibacterales bacterium]OUU61397.1 MAG: haloacid dehalogenase, type II [Alphaproteobacteria bacterium TMED62]|tara:strand:- start:498 stop:1205 length:708 start_codon:yes stop_codon:yes gene_type:complete